MIIDGKALVVTLVAVQGVCPQMGSSVSWVASAIAWCFFHVLSSS